MDKRVDDHGAPWCPIPMRHLITVESVIATINIYGIDDKSSQAQRQERL